MENVSSGRWACVPGVCPNGYGSKSLPLFTVQKRWLNVAKIMFLTSTDGQQNPDDLVDKVAARIQELTEEIVDFSIECHELEGGYINHAIHGAELVPKKVTKHRFRKRIFEAWNHSCAYCGQPADTLDHVVPRVHGGLTISKNLLAACRVCNGSKCADPVYQWYRRQPFWSADREIMIEEWTGLEPPD
jgi:5-methylcytosine-specific restriction endonuclease McrA